MEGQWQCITSPTRALRLLTLVLVLATAAAEDQCDGPVLRLLVANSRYAPPRTLYGVLATFGGIPSLNLSQPVQLLAAEPLNACAPLQLAPPGAVFLVERGNCSFADKYAAAVAAGGAGMLLYDDVPGCITMGGVANGSTNSSSGGGSNGTQPAARNASDPAAISLLHDDGVALLGELRAGGRLTLQWQLLDVPALDASALLLWLLAVGTVAGGALWCGSDYAAELKGWPPSPEDGGWQQQQHSSSGGSSSHHTGGGGLEVLEITTVGACGFVAVSSGMLLLLYFFMSKVLLWVILFGFAAAGAQALTLLLLPAALAAAPRLAARSVVLPAWCGRCGGGGSDGGGLEIGLAELLVAPLAVATAVVWAVCRNASWSWALQDLLGVAIMLLVLRTLRLPNLRVACVLLPLCFAYDVFWVFLQPLLSGSGSSSVMVEVASGAGSSEFLPMLLRVPRLSGPPIIRGAYSLLGFGDVILPGLLVALTRRLDILMAAAASSDATAPAVDAGSTKARAGCVGGSGCHGGYFLPAVMGYAAGLLLTYVALMFSWFGDQGQPALLYLVPCTLGVVLLLAAGRGELRELMHVALEPADEELQVDAGAAAEPGSDWDDGDEGGAVSGSERVALLAGAPASTSGGGGGGNSDSSSGRQQRSRRAALAAPGPVAEGVQGAAWWPHQQQQQQQQQCDWGGTPLPNSQQEQAVSSNRLPRPRSRSSSGSRSKQLGCSDL